MTKKKTEESEIVTIERGPWEINKAHVVKVDVRDNEVVIYTQPMGEDGPPCNYVLTHDEAAPFLEDAA